MLDTNVVIALIRKRPASVRNRYRQVVEQNIKASISAVTLFELYHGAAKSNRKEESLEILERFVFSELDVIPFTDEDAPIAGELTAHLESQGRRIGPHDILIAAQALRIGMTLVTANTAEFSRVPDLLWEDWTKAE